MKYYFLSNSTGSDIGSRYPQTDLLGGTASLRAIHEMKSYAENQPIDLDSIKLHAKAKVTDFISSAMFSSPGFLISEKVKALLMIHKMSPQQFFSAVIETKGKRLENYHRLHFVQDDSKYINFRQCTLSTFKPAPMETPGWNHAYEKIDIQDYNQLKETWKTIGGRKNFTTDKLYLDRSMEGYDLIVLRGFQKPCLISESLKNAFEKEKVTGYKLHEAFPIVLS